MAEPFLGEIRNFSFGFAPTNWAQCNGQILQISQNQALFALLGVYYGGDGKTTFGLPNLNGRYPVGTNSSYPTGATGGEATHVLTQAEIPTHYHTLQASASNAAPGTQATNAYPATSSADIYAPSSDTTLGPGSSPSGGSQGHQNMSPYLAVNYCIALVGIYPPRS